MCVSTWSSPSSSCSREGVPECHSITADFPRVVGAEPHSAGRPVWSLLQKQPFQYHTQTQGSNVVAMTGLQTTLATPYIVLIVGIGSY